MKERNSSGGSLVELLVVVIIMAFVSAAAFGMMTTILGDTIKVQNKCDSIDATRNAIDKIGRTIRMGRSVGDLFGAQVNGVCTGSISFPSNQNPIYPNGQAMPNGWPVWADGSSPTGLNAYTLSSQCLIVQRPIFDSGGFPLAIRAGQVGPGVPATSVCNVVTDIYRVVPDPNNNGEWLLQWCELPGLTVTGYTASGGNQLGPITLCTGIIGPLAGGQPRVFAYYDKNGTNNGAPRLPGDGLNPPMDANNIGRFNGVEILLEVRNHKNSGVQTAQGVWLKDSVLAFKQSVFLRNNSLATISTPR